MNVGGITPIFDERLNERRRGMGIYRALTETTDAVYAGSAVAEGVEVAGGGEEGGEVGSERGFGDWGGEGEVFRLSCFFERSDS